MCKLLLLFWIIQSISIIYAKAFNLSAAHFDKHIKLQDELYFLDGNGKFGYGIHVLNNTTA
jgi:hypothetical protein